MIKNKFNEDHNLLPKGDVLLLDDQNVEPGDIITVRKSKNLHKDAPFNFYAGIVTAVLSTTNNDDEIAGFSILPFMQHDTDKRLKHFPDNFIIGNHLAKKNMSLPQNKNYEVKVRNTPTFIPNSPEYLGTKNGDVKCIGSLTDDKIAWGNFVEKLQHCIQHKIHIPINTADLIEKPDTQSYYTDALLRKELIQEHGIS
ncbi:MAG: hypothetical protein ACRBDI_00770 [Alphaproteobacteria bacterium]